MRPVLWAKKKLSGLRSRAEDTSGVLEFLLHLLPSDSKASKITKERKSR
jgi:hypothetical protein